MPRATLKINEMLNNIYKILFGLYPDSAPDVVSPLRENSITHHSEMTQLMM